MIQGVDSVSTHASSSGWETILQKAIVGIAWVRRSAASCSSELAKLGLARRLLFFLREEL